MKLIGTGVLSLVAALTQPISVHAQGQTLSASAIPDGVESRFCYYAGLAYSKQSYIVITGNNSSGESLDRLLECVADDDGTLQWVGRSKIQTGK